jgi:hypothetical protein
MYRTNFTDYDEKPEGMINYMRYYGPHFNKKLSDFAASLMTKEDDKPIKPVSKEDLRRILLNAEVTLKHDQLYDSVYVANMCRADFFGDSIEDELHMARYIRNVIDDPDAVDGLVFNRWYADMCYKGIAIDWSEML